MLKLGGREFHRECAPMSLDGDLGLLLGGTVVGISHLYDGSRTMDRGEGVATQMMAEMTREMEEKQKGWGIEALCDLKHYYAICHHCDSLIEIHRQVIIAFSTLLGHIHGLRRVILRNGENLGPAGLPGVSMSREWLHRSDISNQARDPSWA